MGEANKDEVEKCKQIAIAAARDGNVEKATRFLEKAKRMCPEDSSIDILLAKVSEGGSFGEATGASAPPGAEGARFRPASASAPPRSTGAQAGMRTNKQGAQYTSEQMQEAQRILRTKDYYDILGVPKSASEEDLKKAYKKLALKLHPDKNKAPGAEEAFKKLSTAMQCLSDKDKKQMYDQYGDEDMMQRNQRHYNQHDMSAEELFASFFTGQAFHAHMRTNRGHHSGDGEQRPNLFSILPVLLLVLLTMASNFARPESAPRFSFSPTGQYMNERTTGNLNIQYYVRNDFDELYSEGSRALADFEKQVDIYYVRSLTSDCDAQEKQKYKKVMMAKRKSSAEELEKAQKQPLPACKEIERIKKKHLNTYRAAMQFGY